MRIFTRFELLAPSVNGNVLKKLLFSLLSVNIVTLSYSTRCTLRSCLSPFEMNVLNYKWDPFLFKKSELPVGFYTDQDGWHRLEREERQVSMHAMTSKWEVAQLEKPNGIHLVDTDSENYLFAAVSSANTYQYCINSHGNTRCLHRKATPVISSVFISRNHRELGDDRWPRTSRSRKQLNLHRQWVHWRERKRMFLQPLKQSWCAYLSHFLMLFRMMNVWQRWLSLSLSREYPEVLLINSNLVSSFGEHVWRSAFPLEMIYASIGTTFGHSSYLIVDSE
jgi:hypothetical protein